MSHNENREVSELEVKRARHEAAILAFARAAGRVRELATESANARRIMELADREMRESHAAFVKALCDSEGAPSVTLVIP